MISQGKKKKQEAKNEEGTCIRVHSRLNTPRMKSPLTLGGKTHNKTREITYLALLLNFSIIKGTSLKRVRSCGRFKVNLNSSIRSIPSMCPTTATTTNITGEICGGLIA